MLYALLPLKYRVNLFIELYAITRYFSKTVVSYSPVCLMYERKRFIDSAPLHLISRKTRYKLTLRAHIIFVTWCIRTDCG